MVIQVGIVTNRIPGHDISKMMQSTRNPYSDY